MRTTWISNPGRLELLNGAKIWSQAVPLALMQMIRIPSTVAGRNVMPKQRFKFVIKLLLLPPDLGSTGFGPWRVSAIRS